MTGETSHCVGRAAEAVAMAAAAGEAAGQLQRSRPIWDSAAAAAAAEIMSDIFRTDVGSS